MAKEIKISFSKQLTLDNGSKFIVMKDAENPKSVLVMEAVESKMEVDLQTMLDLAQFFDAAFKDMNKATNK